jgi:hypothetical protein
VSTSKGSARSPRKAALRDAILAHFVATGEPLDPRLMRHLDRIIKSGGTPLQRIRTELESAKVTRQGAGQ